MALKPKSRRPVGRQSPTPRRRGKAVRTPALALPHERDESVNATAVELDPVIVQAQRDIDAGLVDTDMHATPGLDAELRARLVPGAGGEPLAVVLPTLTAQESDFTAEGAPPPEEVTHSPPARRSVPKSPRH